MLEPSSRTLLLDSLRPPTGYELSAAVGTTYTLDLVALMVAALPFAFFDTEDSSGDNITEPLPLIEALRRNAERITVFCQGGKIGVPAQQRALFAYVEDCIYEVVPRRGAFHPKLWVLRYTAPDGPVRYRLLCLSRNLTFDRSWDTALVLDGTLVDRQNGYASNRPLSDFIKEVAALATQPLSPSRADDIRRVVDECRRVRWEPPEGVDPKVQFWPLGIPGYGSRELLGSGWRQMLVVSPFLTQDVVADLKTRAKYPILISRIAALADMPPASLADYQNIYVLNDAANLEPPEEALDVAPSDAAERHLVGLHAKLYLMHNGWGPVRILTGSANATGAGMRGNVEFLVELIAARTTVTIDRLMEPGTPGAASLRDMLVEYDQADGEQTEKDVVSQELDSILERTELAVASWPLQAKIIPDPEGGFHLELYATDKLSNVGASVSVAPLLAKPRRFPVRPGAEGPIGTWGPMDLEVLTAFFSFEIKATIGSRSRPHTFARRLELLDEPEGRKEAILRTVLQDRGNVLRYLMLLAALDGADSGSSLARARDLTGDSATFAGMFEFGTTLFESLVRALDRDPSRLSQVDRLVRDLRADPESAKLLPDDFASIWDPIWAEAEALLAVQKGAQ